MLDKLRKELAELKREEELNYRKYSLSDLTRMWLRIHDLEKQISELNIEPIAILDDICLVPSSATDDNYVGYYDILMLDTKEKVGDISLEAISEFGQWRHNVGYYVYEEYRNKGYCSKGVNALLRYLKEKKCPFVQISIEDRNAPSLNVAKKLEKEFKVYKTQKDGVKRHLVVLDEKEFSNYLKNIHRDKNYYSNNNDLGEVDTLWTSHTSFEIGRYSEGVDYLCKLDKEILDECNNPSL